MQRSISSSSFSSSATASASSAAVSHAMTRAQRAICEYRLRAAQHWATDRFHRAVHHSSAPTSAGGNRCCKRKPLICVFLAIAFALVLLFDSISSKPFTSSSLILPLSICICVSIIALAIWRWCTCLPSSAAAAAMPLESAETV